MCIFYSRYSNTAPTLSGMEIWSQTAGNNGCKFCICSDTYYIREPIRHKSYFRRPARRRGSGYIRGDISETSQKVFSADSSRNRGTYNRIVIIYHSYKIYGRRSQSSKRRIWFAETLGSSGFDLSGSAYMQPVW